MSEEKIKSGSTMEFHIVLKITEIEARALDGLTGYNMDEFITIFYQHLGKHYLQPHEKGLRSLFDTIRKELPQHLSRFDKTRETFNSK